MLSDKATVQQSAEYVFNFLSDFNNFQRLMPEQVTNWESTTTECSFTIAGMATLGMKLTEKTPNSIVRAVRNGNAPFDFTLTCQIEARGNGADVQLIFDADLNPMLKMMAERPLTNFLNMLVNKLKELQ
jgi:carbon monoxide dehydrogenase subunit G